MNITHDRTIFAEPCSKISLWFYSKLKSHSSFNTWVFRYVPKHHQFLGLGGEACGSTCSQLIPVGLQSALEETNQTAVVYGHPRSSVCPALCSNQLGKTFILGKKLNLWVTRIFHKHLDIFLIIMTFIPREKGSSSIAYKRQPNWFSIFIQLKLFFCL